MACETYIKSCVCWTLVGCHITGGQIDEPPGAPRWQYVINNTKETICVKSGGADPGGKSNTGTTNADGIITHYCKCRTFKVGDSVNGHTPAICKPHNSKNPAVLCDSGCNVPEDVGGFPKAPIPGSDANATPPHPGSDHAKADGRDGNGPISPNSEPWDVADTGGEGGMTSNAGKAYCDTIAAGGSCSEGAEAYDKELLGPYTHYQRRSTGNPDALWDTGPEEQYALRDLVDKRGKHATHCESSWRGTDGPTSTNMEPNPPPGTEQCAGDWSDCNK